MYARVCVCVVCMCVLQVPVIVVSVSAIPKTGGCPESTVSVTTESVISTTGSSAQVMKLKKRDNQSNTVDTIRISKNGKY